jgi:hypothetical protein
LRWFERYVFDNRNCAVFALSEISGKARSDVFMIMFLADFLRGGIDLSSTSWMPSAYAVVKAGEYLKKDYAVYSVGHLKPNVISMLRANLPVICHFSNGHFAVLNSIKGGMFYLSDPNGEYVLNKRKFEEGFSGYFVAESGLGFDKVSDSESFGIVGGRRDSVA